MSVKTSMERYRQIEIDSGIKFFEEVGFLRIGNADDQRANVIHQLALELRKDGVDINDVDEKYASDHFPYLR